MDLKRYIIDSSVEIGIDIIGFTDKLDYSDLTEMLEERRYKGYETEFEETDLVKRLSPKLLLESLKSIIVIGMSYFSRTENQEDTFKGRLSKSATGLDYHIVLTRKMEELIAEMKKVTDFEHRIGVDTTPLMDRMLAKEAGIGWFGKNSLIINDELGSFIFLGYILTDLEIDADQPSEMDCGSCDICIGNCPVGAIKKDYKLDAKRCISYLTQTKVDIPYILRDKMEDKVYGCDTCQMVCPKNKSIIGRTEVFYGTATVDHIDIEEIFSQSNREFKEKYGDKAFSWRGKNVIKRNCIIALGNSKQQSAIGLLRRGLKDENMMIRKYSAWAILKIDLSLGKILLDQHKRIERDQSVIDEIYKLEDHFKISDK